MSITQVRHDLLFLSKGYNIKNENTVIILSHFLNENCKFAYKYCCVAANASIPATRAGGNGSRIARIKADTKTR